MVEAVDWSIQPMRQNAKRAVSGHELSRGRPRKAGGEQASKEICLTRWAGVVRRPEDCTSAPDLFGGQRFPATVAQSFDRTEIDFVRHFRAFFDPVAEINIGYSELPGLFDLP